MVPPLRLVPRQVLQPALQQEFLPRQVLQQEFLPRQVLQQVLQQEFPLRLVLL